MESITIRISATDQDEGGYMFDVWEGDQISDEAPMDSDEGGQCTSTMANALDMAKDAALVLVRAHFSDNVFNNDICPSSLDENGEPMTLNETAHKWDTSTAMCSECGASQF